MLLWLFEKYHNPRSFYQLQTAAVGLFSVSSVRRSEACAPLHVVLLRVAFWICPFLYSKPKWIRRASCSVVITLLSRTFCAQYATSIDWLVRIILRKNLFMLLSNFVFISVPFFILTYYRWLEVPFWEHSGLFDVSAGVIFEPAGQSFFFKCWYAEVVVGFLDSLGKFGYHVFVELFGLLGFHRLISLFLYLGYIIAYTIKKVKCFSGFNLCNFGIGQAVQ